MKKRSWIRLLALLLTVVLLAAGCSSAGGQGSTDIGGSASVSESSSQEESSTEAESQTETEEATIEEDGYYTSPEDVAAYLREYDRLPDNFITKKEAQALGWVSKEGNLWEVTDHMSIGGDRFWNNEGSLPEVNGRKWYECDVNYEGGYRGSERILYSNDGLIYYTDDHYETFTKME